MLRRSGESLAIANYRRYFAGQVVSMCGNWVQLVAEAWLVLRMTGSGLAVGVIPALQFLPLLLLAAPAGLAADRFDKRRILMLTQQLMAAPALALFVVQAAGMTQLWIVYVLVLLRGAVNAVDNPARQSFVIELVGPEHLVNAVSLNSIVVHTARIAGPAIAALLIASVGVGPCFLVNAASFAAMLVALRAMDVAALHPVKPLGRAPGQIRAGLREVARRPELYVPLGMMAVVGTFAFNFQALLPLLAHFEWSGTATTYAFLAASMGVGSVAGAIVFGARARVTPLLLVGTALLFGVSELAAAAAPTAGAQAIALAATGATSVAFAAGVNSSLQLASGDALRGRVMALFSIVFLGTTPIGSPLVGWLSDVTDPRTALLLGATASFAAAAGATAAIRREATRAA